MNFLLKLILAFCFTLTTLSQTLTNERANQFINAMINDSDSLENFVLPEELTLSKRLGINYEGIKNKFLISYEIPLQIIEEIKSKKIDYSIKLEQLDDEFSILHFEVKQKNYETSYYFKNNHLISPPYFFYKDWHKIESEHFIFYISNPVNFNQYSINRLEEFISGIFSVLNYMEDETQLLKEEKIIFILCKDEDEIEKLTGYKARGMFNLAYDYIITTFNCHYHELVHLLMNYKLKDLPLYTHPFLQEGFAVAFGGRGGKEPEVIRNLGYFIAKSKFLDYKKLLSSDEFRNFDVSMSYPLSGLYNLFLIEDIGIDEYINLSLSYSASEMKSIKIKSEDFPVEEEWIEFLFDFGNDKNIKIDIPENHYINSIVDSSFRISEDDSDYLFEIKDDILISTMEKEDDYISKKFIELYPYMTYNGEKYLIRVEKNEVALYNLLTNNLIANYVSGFSISMKTVPEGNGYYKFLIRKNIFDESSKEWSIKIVGNK